MGRDKYASAAHASRVERADESAKANRSPRVKKVVGPKIEVHNANVHGWTGLVDEEKHLAMKQALLHILPKQAPGLTQTEMRNKVIIHLPESLFPEGNKVDWWSKCVQLDLEYQGVIIREKDAKPLKWHRAK
ncbi:MAG: hypothetical protein RL508_694 [Actinomycetota bacterium]